MISLSARMPATFVFAFGILASLSARTFAQECKFNTQERSCVQEGAVCSPVDSGAGNQGKCKTVNPKPEQECACVGQVGGHDIGVVSNTLSSPIFVNLYWDATWDTDNPTMPKDALDNFTAALLNTSYFKGLSEYGVGPASYGGGFLPHPACEQKAPASAEFYQPVGPSIIGFLQCELDHVNLPQGAQVVYNIILPSGSVENDSLGPIGLRSFCTETGAPGAWHFHQTPYSAEADAAIALIVLGGLFGSPGDVIEGMGVLSLLALLPGGPIYTISFADARCGNFVNNLVHEMVEATTDPFPPLSVITSGDGEIADMCENAPPATPFVPSIPVLPIKTSFPQSRNFTTSAAISVPSYWSNASGKCVGFTGATPSGRLGNPFPGRLPILPFHFPFNVTTSGNGATISFTISGQGFGTLPSGITLPTGSNLPYLAIQNNTQGWQAGNSLNGDQVTLNVTSWSDTTITINGLNFSNGKLVMRPNDNLTVWVCNPDSGNCGAVSWVLQESGTPQLNLQVFNSVPLVFDVLIDGKTVAAHTAGGSTGWLPLTPGSHVISEVATEPGIFTPNFFGGCPNGLVALQVGDIQFCTVVNGFNTGCASNQHCCGSVSKFGCVPECISSATACKPLCAQGLNKCCGTTLPTGACDGQCIKAPPNSCP
jgi:hypothetical protein